MASRQADRLFKAEAIDVEDVQIGGKFTELSLPKPYYDHAGITIYHGDCREILPLLPKVDLVLTDPPYGTGWMRGGGSVGEFIPRHEQAWWDEWKDDWFRLCTASAWRVFCPVKRYPSVASLFTESCALYWRKSNPSPMGMTRECLAAHPIPWKLEEWEKTAYNGDCELHPCQKPYEVVQWAMSETPPGTVLDPFMESGTTLRAAKDLGRKAIGIEIEERYCEISAKRMAQEVLNF